MEIGKCGLLHFWFANVYYVTLYIRSTQISFLFHRGHSKEISLSFKKDFGVYIFDSVEIIKDYRNFESGINASYVMRWTLVYGSKGATSSILNDQCPLIFHIFVLTCLHCKQALSWWCFYECYSTLE